MKSYPYLDTDGEPCRIIKRTPLRNGAVLATIEYQDGGTKDIKESRLQFRDEGLIP